MTFKKIKFYPIYIDVKRKKSIKEFIISCLDPAGCNKFKKTFLKKELTYPQCHTARRSFEDIYRIVKTVYPSLNQKKLLKTIIYLNNNKFKVGKNYIALDYYYCSVIGKVVFKGYDHEESSMFNYLSSYNKKGLYSKQDLYNLKLKYDL